MALEYKPCIVIVDGFFILIGDSVMKQGKHRTTFPTRRHGMFFVKCLRCRSYNKLLILPRRIIKMHFPILSKPGNAYVISCLLFRPPLKSWPMSSEIPITGGRMRQGVRTAFSWLRAEARRTRGRSFAWIPGFPHHQRSFPHNPAGYDRGP